MTRRSTRTTIGLVHLVAHHDALKYSLGHSATLRAARAKTFNRVWMRAMSRRTSRTRAVFSSWPLACESAVEGLLLQGGQFALELVRALGAEVLDLHRSVPLSRRVTNRVFTDSLAAASSKASRR